MKRGVNLRTQSSYGENHMGRDINLHGSSGQIYKKRQHVSSNSTVVNRDLYSYEGRASRSLLCS